MSFPVPTVGYILLIGVSGLSLVYATQFNNDATGWSASAAERLQSERRLKVVSESVGKAKPSEDKWLDAEKSKASLSKANAAAVIVSKFSVMKVSVSSTATEAPLPTAKPGEAPSMPSAPAGASTIRFNAASGK
jgi:hypothetical protein